MGEVVRVARGAGAGSVPAPAFRRGRRNDADRRACARPASRVGRVGRVGLDRGAVRCCRRRRARGRGRGGDPGVPSLPVVRAFVRRTQALLRQAGGPGRRQAGRMTMAYVVCATWTATDGEADKVATAIEELTVLSRQ